MSDETTTETETETPTKPPAKPMSRKAKLILGLVLLLPGIYVTYLGQSEIRRTLQVNKATTHVEAKVYDTRVSAQSKGATTHDVLYRFKVDGHEYSFTDATGRKNLWASVNVDEWHDAEKTHRLDVIYDPDDPSINRPASSDKQPILDASAGLLFGLGLLITSIVLLVQSRRAPSDPTSPGELLSQQANEPPSPIS